MKRIHWHRVALLLAAATFCVIFWVMLYRAFFS